MLFCLNCKDGVLKNQEPVKPLALWKFIETFGYNQKCRPAHWKSSNPRFFIPERPDPNIPGLFEGWDETGRWTTWGTECDQEGWIKI